LAQTEAHNDKLKLEEVVLHDTLPVISKLESLTAKSAGVALCVLHKFQYSGAYKQVPRVGRDFFFTLEGYEI
jgi:hypothetical protein